MLMLLATDGFLVARARHPCPGDNVSVFLRPKSFEKAAFIADLRGVNKLTPQPWPRLRLPSASDIGSLMAIFPRGQLWGSTIDLTNFFWSLT